MKILIRSKPLQPIQSAKPATRALKVRSTNLLLLAALGLLLTQAAPAQNHTNTLPFYESFPTNYLEGEQLGSGFGLGGTAGGMSGTNWITGNSVSSSSARINSAAAMAWPGLQMDPSAFGSPANSRGMRDGTGTGKNRGLIFAPPITDGSVYASFLFSLQTVAPANRLFASLSATVGTGPSVSVGFYINTAGQLLVGKGKAVTDTTLPAGLAGVSLIPSNTYLVVVRYKFNSGATTNDEVALWLNPTPLGDDASVPPPNVTTTNGNDSTFLQAFYYLRASTAGINNAEPFFMDELRIGTNWSDVTPATPSPGTIYSVTGGGTQCAGGSFPIGVSGSDVGVDYLLYTNGAFSGQITSGAGGAITFGAQNISALYTVLASNTASMNVGWMKTNATVSIFANPAIVTQPSSIIVANGGLGAISVVASGDILSYHWRRNGVNLSDGANISGATTANLVINPAGPGDAATTLDGYDVVITNSCGLVTATSTRVALTIDSPADLVWSSLAGNLWDVGISMNWNNDTAVFNFGDNVRFDDNGNFLNVNLASSFLSPSKITVNRSLGSYNFLGSGSIVGSGSLLLEAGGLTIAMANSFTGGTTVSNGTLAIFNVSALGSGPLTLAGGNLSTPNVQGFALNNVINVVADSSITVSNTSTSALVITNTLSGSAGTLTFINGSNGRGPTIQLLYPGFTFNQPIDLNLGGNGTNLLLQGQNSTGNQIFNGVISGGGQIRRAASGGATILNALNTYLQGTIINNGNIGVGIDSVSTTPPTIDSGPLGTGPLYIDVGAGSPGLFASGGARTVGNPIAWTGATIGSPLALIGTNDLTLSGAVDLSGTNRTLRVDNTGLTTLSGVISDGGFANGLIKTGTNTLALSAINTYTGPTIVSNGTLLVNGQLDVGDVTVAGGALGGTGTILGQVTVQAAGTLSPGASMGTLTINNNLTLNGNLFIEVKRSLSPAQSNDFTVVSGTLNNTGAGTLTVSNLDAAPLAVGNKFTLFNKPLANGGAITVTGGGMNWNNNLAADGSITAAAVAVSQPPLISSTVISGGNITISGTNGTAGASFTVLSSTNLTTPRASWTVETTGTFGAGGSFSVNIPVSSTTPAKFYLLKLP